jgi:hypothetical protein
MNGLIEQVALLGFLTSNITHSGVRFPAIFHSGQQALCCSITLADHNGISDGFVCLNTFPSTTNTLNTARRSSIRSVAGDSRSGSPSLVRCWFACALAEGITYEAVLSESEWVVPGMHCTTLKCEVERKQRPS